MRADQISDAEAIRLELRILRRRISEMGNSRLFDEVEALISLAEAQVERTIVKLRRERP